MSLEADLLEQAGHLVTREPGRPKQASLRRAISTAYYSLFHLVIADATRFLVGNSRLRPVVTRSFEHQGLKAAAEAVTAVARSPNGRHWLRPHLEDPISNDLVMVCDNLVGLQEQRHRADYDVGVSFTRVEATGAVSLALQAHSVWPREKGTANAHAFMLAAAKLVRQR